MPAAYMVGQEVMINPVKGKGLSVREAALNPYAGTIGKIIDFHWMRPPTGQVFYLYTVQASDKEIVLYEDEITPAYSVESGYRKIKGK
ncbi:hypothetical protein ACFLYQ_06470 [Chloroflexota bacterium]